MTTGSRLVLEVASRDGRHEIDLNPTAAEAAAERCTQQPGTRWPGPSRRDRLALVYLTFREARDPGLRVAERHLSAAVGGPFCTRVKPFDGPTVPLHVARAWHEDERRREARRSARLARRVATFMRQSGETDPLGRHVAPEVFDRAARRYEAAVVTPPRRLRTCGHRLPLGRREHRPGGRRRTAASSTTSGTDPGDPPDPASSSPLDDGRLTAGGVA